MPVPDDWCYVHNFTEPLKPLTLRLSPGLGRQLSADMDGLVQECRQRIPLAFEGPDYQRHVEEGVSEVQGRYRAITQELVTEAKRQGVAPSMTPMGVMATPLGPGGEPMDREEFEKLPKEEQARLQQAHEELHSYIQRRSSELRQLEKEEAHLRQELDRKLAIGITSPLFEDLRAKYHNLPQVLHYLDQVQEDVISSLHLFRPSEQAQPSPMEAAAMRRSPEGDEWNRYKVNVLVSHHGGTGAPVVFEDSPTYYNIFGRVEHQFRMGAMSTNFTQVRAGSLHQANGGFLVLQAKDALASPGVWQAMKQSLRSRLVHIENLGEQFSAIPVSTLSPEPIPMTAKLVLVGNASIFRLLLLHDEEFHKFFKVKADFDTVMDLDQNNVRKYASFIAARTQEEQLRHFDAGAVAAVVKYSSRLVEDQEKLTTRFSEVAALVTEANYWAGQSGNDPVIAPDVERAVAEHTHRSNLIEERLQDLYDHGTVRIQVDGAVVGQVNGLAVIDLGDYSFGRPSRLTARVSLGRGEVSNIDQESRMAGPIHSKGFQILLGYLMIQVDGAVVGQVNGLAVIDLGDYSFGRPSRLTARVSLGRGEVSNIDQESRMAGPIHSKGFQILLGYLMGKYGVDSTLPIRATVAFEQTYSEVEGNSASSAELFALLSSLANVPLRQALAVTGSVDQHGEVQAVGGVTRKVEGFYEVCKARGLNGEQGVLIPASNVRHLVLSQEVVEAVREGKFRIFAVSSIEEGLELLTGIPTGEAQPDGTYEPGTLNYLVHQTIDEMWERTRAVQRAGPGETVVRREVTQAGKASEEQEDRERDRREGDGEPPPPAPA